MRSGDLVVLTAGWFKLRFKERIDPFPGVAHGLGSVGVATVAQEAVGPARVCDQFVLYPGVLKGGGDGLQFGL